MTDKLEVTQADNDVTVALTEWLINREVFFEDGPPKLEKIMHDFGAFADDLIARHRATHSGEGRSHGAGEIEEIKAVLVAVFGDANWRQKNPILARRVNVAMHKLAALTPQGDGEVERLRAALSDLLDDIEDEWIDYYLRSDSAERAKCKRCGGDDFFKSSIEHKEGCLVGRIRAALQRDTGEGQ